jgi:hypothetical protein
MKQFIKNYVRGKKRMGRRFQGIVYSSLMIMMMYIVIGLGIMDATGAGFAVAFMLFGFVATSTIILFNVKWAYSIGKRLNGRK